MTAIRVPRGSERDAVIDAVRAVGLLADAGVAETAAELDAFLAAAPGAGAWLVGVDGAAVIGVAYYAPERMTDRTWNLYLLAVRPEWQGHGHGAALVRAVEADLRMRGVRLVVVETSGTRQFAAQRRFYAGLGYAQQGWITDFYEPGDDKVVFARSLAALARTTDPGPRVATPHDLPRLVALADAFYREDGFTTTATRLARRLGTLVTSPTVRVAVTDHGDAVIAFAVTTTGFGLEQGLIAELEDLYVVPDARRGGLGTSLVEDAAAWATNRGCAALEIVIAPNGRDVHDLDRYYAALGFTDAGRRLRSRVLR